GITSFISIWVFNLVPFVVVCVSHLSTKRTAFSCMDTNYRSNPESPTVVFWDHEEEDMEKAIYPVCSTFTELLASLRDFEED
ncbi:hypothetical protein AAHB49_00200, partial [Bacillus cereus]